MLRVDAIVFTFLLGHEDLAGPHTRLWAGIFHAGGTGTTGRSGLSYRSGATTAAGAFHVSISLELSINVFFVIVKVVRLS